MSPRTSDLLRDPDAYLRHLRTMPAFRRCGFLMARISACKSIGMTAPDSWWAELRTCCAPKRLKRFRKKMTSTPLEDYRAPREAIPRLRLTKSVEYRYQETDNARIAEFYDSREWAAMRYEALRLHGARCQCCGATPSDGRTVLNVDHIKPLRVFWDLRLDLNNLQILCGGCNLGKGARHADDWRNS